jgi:hypothetical protein
LSDPGTAAAVLSHLVQLQQQRQGRDAAAAAAAAAEDTKTLTKQCCRLVAEHLTTGMQAQLAAAAPAAAAGGKEPGAAARSAATASAAATVMWATSQLSYRDKPLAAVCLKTFHAYLQDATAADAAAAVAALSAPGRAVNSIYSCESTTLQEVVAECTDKLLVQQLLQPLLAGRADNEAAAAAAAAAAAGEVHTGEDAAVAAAAPAEAPSLAAAAAAGVAGQSPVVVAQQLLQLHAAVALQPSSEQTYLLLSVVSEESSLAQLRPNTAVAAMAASLAAVAELAELPDWQGFSSSSSSGGGRRQQQQQLQFPWAWQSQQQQQLQELWQQLLLECLLPRFTSATPKQLVTVLQALVVFAGRDGQQQQQQQQRRQPAATYSPSDGLQPAAALDIGLAKDFARCVLDVIAPQHLPAATVAAAGDGSVSSSSSSGFLAGWRPGEWKGEHLAALATAAVQLDVPFASFFAAAEAQLMQQQQQQNPSAASGGDKLQQQQQQQQRSSLVANVQLQHVISMCCAAAALDCRVERLLSYAVTEALQQQQQQQQQELAGKQQTSTRKSKQHAPALHSELLLLLSWAVAVMDVPQLAHQAAELAATAVLQLKQHQTAAAPRAQQDARGTAAAAAATLPDALAARLLQLNIWLADKQPSTGTVSSSSSSGDHQQQQHQLLLAAGELQAATAAWISLQQSSNSYTPAVAAALSHLTHSQPQLHVAHQGGLVADVYSVINGIPVAVLVLDDAEEWPGVVQGGDAAAAAESLAEGWAPPWQQQQRSRQQHEQQQHSQKQGQGQPSTQLVGPSSSQQGRGAAVSSSRSSNSTCSSGLCELLLAALSKQRLGDVMWRAKALANRGYWCEVVSSRDWALLEGHLDAQVDYLRDRLWPLLPQQQEEQGYEGPAGASSRASPAQAQAI